MGTHGRIDLHAMCLNEARMIPYFLSHWDTLVDRFLIYDNGSTDGSQALLAADPRVSIRPFETQGDSFVDHARLMLDAVWKTSRGDADWVIVVELDEHLHHADLRAYLDHALRSGVTAIRSVGYQMTSETFPADPRPLCEQVVAGVRDRHFDKLAIFRPDALTETNFGAGRHQAHPAGTVAYEPLPQVKLLHYKHLGADYVFDRNEVLGAGLRARDLSRNWGAHYLRTRAAVERDMRDLIACSRRVPGLASRGPLDLTMDEEELTIRDSGLFDAVHYTTAHPGLGNRCGIDPLADFCRLGWREGMSPNSHFDPAWYAARYGTAPGVNPLLEYIVAGERAGRSPIAWFDPALYRQQHRLSLDRSPLLHFMLNGAGRRDDAKPASEMKVLA